MSMQATLSAEQSLSELAERLDQWRQTKTKRSDPIPDTLWSQGNRSMIGVEILHTILLKRKALETSEQKP